jgi:Polysaccharide lyase
VGAALVGVAVSAGVVAPSPSIAASSTKTPVGAVSPVSVGYLDTVSKPAERAKTLASSSTDWTTTVIWDHFQRPSLNGVVQQSSIQETDAPGPAAGRPTSKVMRFSLDPAARYVSAGYSAPRVEVYSRMPASPTLVPASDWPDPVGSVRWYTFSIYLPSDFQTSTGTDWVDLTQWKGLEGGTPPIALEVKKNTLRLGGARTNAGLIPNGGILGALPLGQWTTLTVGMSLSTSATDGWVEVRRDGVTVLPKTFVSTMDMVAGHVDPIYLKQGIYQNAAWTQTHVLYAGPVVISTAAPDAQ